MTPFLLSFLFSMVTTWLTMPWLLNICHKRRLYDFTNERKIHHNKIPRLGGIVFVPSITVGLFAALVLSPTPDVPLNHSKLLVVGAVVLIYFIGALDDLLSLSARMKFLVQVLASVAFIASGLVITDLQGLFWLHELPYAVGVGLTVFCCLLIINAINLIDGIDGLAACISIIALSGFFLLFAGSGTSLSALAAAALIGALVGFLPFNLFEREAKHRKTFMGDSGSLLLGVSLAYFGIKYACQDPSSAALTSENGVIGRLVGQTSPLFVAGSLLMVPVFDLCRVAVARLLRGQSPFHADKTHIHHRLMARGLNQHQTLCIILGFQLGFLILNGLLVFGGLQPSIILLIDIILYLVMTEK